MVSDEKPRQACGLGHATPSAADDPYKYIIEGG